MVSLQDADASCRKRHLEDGRALYNKPEQAVVASVKSAFIG